jgi:AcrR family transcriptional regulator
VKRAVAARRAPTRREQQGLDSRRRILDAASSLMTERGFAGTSISEVSRLSRLPASSIYWHFESKEGLLGAVVEEGAQRWFESLPARGEHGRRGASAAALLRAAATQLEKGPEFLRLMLLIALERKEIDPTSLAMIRRVRRLALDHIEKMVAQEGGAPGAELARDLAGLVLAAADGLFVAHHIDPRATDVAAQFELLRRALAALGRELARNGR